MGIGDWSEGRTSVNDFMSSPTGVMAFNACVMRLQVIQFTAVAISDRYRWLKAGELMLFP